MTEISFRGKTAREITTDMTGRRLLGAVADLQEITLVNLFKIALRRGCVQQQEPPFRIYHLGAGQFDATFEIHEQG